MRQECGNVFSATADLRSRHASQHVRHVRAAMQAGIANWRFLSRMLGKRPGIPGPCATHNFTYLVRGPLNHTLVGPRRSAIVSG